MTPPSTPRRAVLYGRVSKLADSEKAAAHQHGRPEGRSVDQQLNELRSIARREGVEIIGTYRDDGISASRYARGKAREGWQQVMASIIGGAVTELWTWEISRATRDRPVWASLLNACIAGGVLITVGGKVHDPSDADDAFMLDLFAALAVRESAVTSKRIRRGVRDRAQKGLPHGRIPYGYAREYDPTTRALIRQHPDRETADIVKMLARRVLAGESMYSLEVWLNRYGVLSPETERKRRNGDTASSWPWRQDQIRDVILSPAAAGLRVHQGEVLDGVTAAWEAIINKDDHTRLVNKLTDPKRRSWVDASVKHLLAGLARCGVCGSPMRRTNNRGKYAAYTCWGGKGTGCTGRKQQWVDTFVTDVIIERLEQPDLLDVFVTDDADDVQAAQHEVAALRAELAELRTAKRAGRISLASFIDFEPDIMAKIDNAERRATPAAVPALIADLAGPNVRPRWEALTMPQRRQVIRTLCTVCIYKARPGARTFDPATVKIEWLKRGETP